MQVIIHDRFLGEVANQTHGKLPFPSEVATVFRMRLNQIMQAQSTQDLRNLKSLHFEKLKEKRYKDKYSIRINKSYRIIFRIDINNGVEIIGIEEISNHYS
jgi:proteic killer suppression protein